MVATFAVSTVVNNIVAVATPLVNVTVVLLPKFMPLTVRVPVPPLNMNPVTPPVTDGKVLLY